MPSPFPGMDPYLEDPEMWSGFHHSFLTAIQEQLAPLLKPKYFVRAEERVYVANEEDPAYRMIVPDVRVIEARSARRAQAAPQPATSGPAVAEPIPVVELPDPEIHEFYLQIYDRADRTIVTVIEMLSPTNKVRGSEARRMFLQKRHEVYGTPTHWMEIDLLREGSRTANLAETAAVEYQVYLSRGGSPRRGFVWPIRLMEQLPVIKVPLRGDDPDVPLNLQEAMDHVYEIGGYEMDVDYAKDTVPPLKPETADWARGLIAK